MPEVSLGVDFGSTALRAAFAPPNEQARAVVLPRELWPWPACELNRGGPFPVGFPSVKDLLGDARAEAKPLVVRALRALREGVEKETSCSVGPTAIAVPARYGSAARTELRDAAREAGLTQVRLVSDSVAAVIGHTAGSGSGTVLVVSMGYGGYEAGLVRAVRGHFRALGYEGAATPGGASFDTWLLAGVLKTLQQAGSWEPEDTADLREEDWLRLREVMERLKEGTSGRAELPLGDGMSGQISFDRAKLTELLLGHAKGAVDSAAALVDQSGLSASDVDTVLLVGRSTTIEGFGEAAARLGGNVVVGPPELLAHGALRYAQRPGGDPDDSAAAVTSGDATAAVGLAELPLPDAQVLDAPVRAPGIRQARKLLEEGRPREARTLLRRIIDDAQRLLDEIAGTEPEPEPEPERGPVPQPRPVPSTGTAADWLALAHDLLEKKQFEQAVHTAHRAWKTQPDEPDIFEAMIRVHCDAAAAASGAEHFEDARRWLICAHAHDPSNDALRGTLVLHSYAHARELAAQGSTAEAADVLRQCLEWEPEHPEVQELLNRLTRRPGSTSGRRRIT
ncbi:Hsp70 family protein [Streptomyces beijiangensis]|uniref:Hsp70 family protein n=1 Tax=Streptomyces beijiangensis TaxID=163361 RepID=A0A939F7E1_9ACTN|nr:Hsp70 family protein [Streptomyces beijiangensis]MBO0512963.1 Hsp70 family protein [Streptomyces beijiangensis]